MIDKFVQNEIGPTEAHEESVIFDANVLLGLSSDVRSVGQPSFAAKTGRIYCGESRATGRSVPTDS